MRDQELILRFLALYFNGANYRKPMKEFLNSYMGKNRRLGTKDALGETFVRTIAAICNCLGRGVFKPRRQISAAVYDAVMVGVARRLERGPIENCEAVQKKYDALLKNKAFVDATETGTASEENVSQRIRLATEAFAEVE